jgi:hypothetical protein
VDHDGDALRMPDDLDLRDIGALGFRQLKKAATDRKIFVQGFGIFTGLNVPVRAPVLVDTDS